VADKSKAARYISVLLLLVVVVITISLSFSAYHLRQEGKSFRENYARLKVGLSKEDVRAIWGIPEYTLSVTGGKEMWSYKDEGHPIHFVDKITFSEDIPLGELGKFCTYSNAELLFDEDGSLVAYTKIGEEIAIHTKSGDVAGSGWEAYSRFLKDADLEKSGNREDQLDSTLAR
jgi:hypothetical protein